MIIKTGILAGTMLAALLCAGTAAYAMGNGTHGTPHRPVSDQSARTDVSEMKNPGILLDAIVQSSEGEEVGTVDYVMRDGRGRAHNVEIRLADPARGSPRSVSVSADQLSFDVEADIVVAGMTRKDLEALPAANPRSAMN